MSVYLHVFVRILWMWFVNMHYSSFPPHTWIDKQLSFPTIQWAKQVKQPEKRPQHFIHHSLSKPMNRFVIFMVFIYRECLAYVYSSFQTNVSRCFNKTNFSILPAEKLPKDNIIFWCNDVTVFFYCVMHNASEYLTECSNAHFRLKGYDWHYFSYCKQLPQKDQNKQWIGHINMYCLCSRI